MDRYACIFNYRVIGYSILILYKYMKFWNRNQKPRGVLKLHLLTVRVERALRTLVLRTRPVLVVAPRTKKTKKNTPHQPSVIESSPSSDARGHGARFAVSVVLHIYEPCVDERVWWCHSTRGSPSRQQFTPALHVVALVVVEEEEG